MSINPKLPDMSLTAKELAFSFGVEESFHAHDAKTNRASFIASLKLQKQRGITSPLHPEYNLLPHEKSAMRVVQEAMGDAGLVKSR